MPKSATTPAVADVTVQDHSDEFVATPATTEVHPAEETGVALTDDERSDARKEGAKDAEKEAGKELHNFLTDGSLPSDTLVNPYLGSEEIQMWAHLVDLGVEAFQKAVSEDAVPMLANDKIAGLLKLERNGKNRTPYVVALCKRLGIKDPREVPGAGGPDYTNDVHPVTSLGNLGL